MAASGKITSPPKRPSEGLQRAAEKARIFAELSRSDNTRRAYKASWADFEAWCEQEGLEALPARPETVVLYVSDRADDLKLGTIGHRLAAISTAHNLAGYPNPASRREEPLRSIWQGMARVKGSRKEQKEPLLKKHLEVMVEELDRSCSSEADWLRNARDKALLLVGFAGAFRRSELSTMKVDDLRFDERGVQILVERSKTDTAGEGQWVGIPATGTELCPVRALRDWLPVSTDRRRACISIRPARTCSSRRHVDANHRQHDQEAGRTGWTRSGAVLRSQSPSRLDHASSTGGSGRSRHHAPVAASLRSGAPPICP